MARPIEPQDLRAGREGPKRPYRQILVDEMAEGLHAPERSPNAIGGSVFVALLKYSHATRKEPKDQPGGPVHECR